MDTSQGALADIVERLRISGTDLERIEVKAAAGGFPKSLYPTISAYSNRGGGVIILGLDEDGFVPAPGFDASAVRAAAAEVFRARGSREEPGPLTPTPTGAIDIGEVDGAPVVVIDIAELSVAQKPCFVTTQGVPGSYERLGDGDHRMSTYAIFLMGTDKAQPEDDRKAVSAATLDDLDVAQVRRFIHRLRTRRRRAVADLSDDLSILRRFHIVAFDGESPTVGGLLALGRYPQQFFPQAMITFAVYPGSGKDSIIGDTRMLDRRILEGPIPLMVDDAVAAVTENLKRRRVSRGAGAADEPEIPVDAIREAVTNALTHRDYSAQALGEQVRIEMFPDRVEVFSPGGIWGGRSADDLFDGGSRSRNAALASLLTEVPLPEREDESVSENQGTGIPRMVGALRRAGLAAPVFRVRTTDLTVVLDRTGLLDPVTVEWLGQVGASELTADMQRALALAHRGGEIDEHVLRVNLGIDTDEARFILRELVSRGWLRFPSSHGSPYRTGPVLEIGERNQGTLLAGLAIEVAPQRTRLDDRIILALREHGELGIRPLAEATRTTPGVLRRRLRVLIEQGAIVATAGPQSKHRTYRLPQV